MRLMLASLLLTPVRVEPDAGTEVRRARRNASRGARKAAVLAERAVEGASTMAEGGIQKILADMGAEVRVQEARLTAEEEKEYGGWKRLGMALGHFADLVEQNERDGYFTVGLLATCPSMPAQCEV